MRPERRTDFCRQTQRLLFLSTTTKEHKLSEDVALAAKSSATVVILMGMSKLSQIVALFKKEGKSEMPIAIIQNGTQKDEKVGMGTIASIEKEVQRQALANPAIIVIGEVVRHREMMTDLQGVVASGDLLVSLKKNLEVNQNS